MDSNTMYRSLFVVLVSAIANGVIMFCLLSPMVSWNQARNMEMLQFGPQSKTPAPQPQADTKPVVPTESQAVTPEPSDMATLEKEPAVKPHIRRLKKKVEETPEVEDTTQAAEPTEAATNNSESAPAAEESEDATTQAAVDKIKADEVSKSQEEEAAAPVTAVVPKEDPNEVKPEDIKPVTDRVAGVQAADDNDAENDTESSTEATSAEVNPPNPTADADSNANIVDQASDPKDN